MGSRPLGHGSTDENSGEFRERVRMQCVHLSPFCQRSREMQAEYVQENTLRVFWWAWRRTGAERRHHLHGISASRWACTGWA
jgi:hypothetical protein